MFYHLSDNFHGLEVTFKPRIPTNGWLAKAYLIEDNKTKRICFSRSLSGAARAIDACDHVYVYTASKLPGFIDPSKNIKKFNKKHNVKYDDNFSPDKEYDYTGLVPDSLKTKEVWATKPTKLKFYGIYSVEEKRIISKNPNYKRRYY